MTFDLDDILRRVSRAELPSVDEVEYVINESIKVFDKEPNVLTLKAPITVCGDTHGQLSDCLHMFSLSPPIPQTRYLFLGDYVDRGKKSIELTILLLINKIKYPDSLYLLRGNHEIHAVNSEYGFLEEIKNKYSNTKPFDLCNECFKYMPFAAIIENRVFCCHGGLSPGLTSISELDSIERRVQPDYTSIMSNILWSDPSDKFRNYTKSSRRSGYFFGKDQASQFLSQNNLEYIIRSHELVGSGYYEHFGGLVRTVWNAPCYSEGGNNDGSYIRVGRTVEEDEVVKFKPSQT